MEKIIDFLKLILIILLLIIAIIFSSFTVMLLHDYLFLKDKNYIQQEITK
jgi:hypothetical protein